MTTLTQTTPETAAVLRNLASAKLRRALSHVLKTFEATPDDLLDFKPSETAMSPRELVVHILLGNGYVGRAMGIEGNPEEGPTDRESLISRLNASTEVIIAKIEGLSDESMDSIVPFGPGPMPMPMFLFINEWHFSRHAGQIDYIQTIHGDMENYF